MIILRVDFDRSIVVGDGLLELALVSPAFPTVAVVERFLGVDLDGTIEVLQRQIEFSRGIVGDPAVAVGAGRRRRGGKLHYPPHRLGRAPQFGVARTVAIKRGFR